MNGFKYLKGLLLTIMLVFALPNLNAQAVSYKHKPDDDKEGLKCHVEYSIAKLEDKYSLLVEVSSSSLHLLPEVSLWMKTFDGDIIKLKGYAIGERSKSVSYKYETYTSYYPVAQFDMSEEQLNLLNKGISKVRLSTYPYEHEKTFEEDCLGKELYKYYTDLKKAYEEF